MRSSRSIPARSAFTLIEMLCVIAIIAILAALLLPALNQGQARAKRLQCVNNLKEVGIAFHCFAHDHNGRFPMELSSAQGGSQEYVQNGYLVPGEFYFSFRHFQPLSNDLTTPKVLYCPTELQRQAAANFGTFKNDNLSFFVGVNSGFSWPNSILAGDRNVTNISGKSTTILHSDLAHPVRWTQELHRFKGNLLFADAHVEQMNSENIGPAGRQVALNADLFLPSVQVSSSPGSPPLMPPPPPPMASAGMRSSPDRNRPAAPNQNSPGKGGSSALMMVEARQTLATYPEPSTNVEVPTNSIAVVPPQPAQPEKIQEPEPASEWSDSSGHGLARKAAWLLYLLLLLFVAALVTMWLRQRSRRTARLKSSQA